MDEKNSNIRLVKTGGRRVTKAATEYDRNGSGEMTEQSKAPKRTMRGLEKRVHYQKLQKQKRLKRQRIRTLLALVMTVLVLSIVLFLTPLFNIRSVTVEGNIMVGEEQFSEKLKPLIGENLFRTGSGKIRKALKTISYINTVDVQKKLFPPSVKVTVTEYSLAAALRAENKNLLVNNEMRVLVDNAEVPAGIPVITGIAAANYNLGDVLEADDAEKIGIASTILSTLEATGLLDKVSEIDLNSVTDITLNYDNRITVKCGTQLDLEHKLRFFKEAVTSNSLSETARGSIQFTETGKAIYSP